MAIKTSRDKTKEGIRIVLRLNSSTLSSLPKWNGFRGLQRPQHSEPHSGGEASQQRGNPVTLLVSETTGALSRSFVDALRVLGKQSRAPTTHDSTCYGTARTSPDDCFCDDANGYVEVVAAVRGGERSARLLAAHAARAVHEHRRARWEVLAVFPERARQVAELAQGQRRVRDARRAEQADAPLVDVARVEEDDGPLPRRARAQPVSYTHLTLPTKA